MHQKLSTNDMVVQLLANSNKWTTEGAKALVGYLEREEEKLATGSCLFNAVKIRCEWNEYDSLFSFADKNFGGCLPDWEILDLEKIGRGIREHLTEEFEWTESSNGSIVVRDNL